jgi:hypothetical protein
LWIHKVVSYDFCVDTRDASERRTPTINIRVPRGMWDAYGRVCARTGKDRSEGLIAHMRKMIRQLGDEADLADLAAAETELEQRRSRKGGRPRKE